MVYSGKRQVSGRERMQEFSLESNARRLEQFYYETFTCQMNGSLRASIVL